MSSSSWFRYLSLSSSTRRRCLWSGSSWVRMASSIMRLSSDSVCLSRASTESWFSSWETEPQLKTWTGFHSHYCMSARTQIFKLHLSVYEVNILKLKLTPEGTNNIWCVGLFARRAPTLLEENSPIILYLNRGTQQHCKLHILRIPLWGYCT